MPDFEAKPHEEHPATAQIITLMVVIFGLCLVVFSGGTNPSRDLMSVNDSPLMISNPQVDSDETMGINQAGVISPMFNLENPNGWATPHTVTLVGTFQDELGCETDNDRLCSTTQMTYDILGDIWHTSLTIPTGSYSYRAYLDDQEQYIYGKNGTSGTDSPAITFTVNRTQTVNFYYDHKTGWITDDVNSVILTLPSNFQDKVGCREEWNAGCFRTWLQDIEGDGIYTYETLYIPNGSWETRVAVNGNIETSYGQGGTFADDNIPLWIPNIGHLTVFTWDDNLKTLTIFVSNVPIRLSTDLPILAPNQ